MGPSFGAWADIARDLAAEPPCCITDAPLEGAAVVGTRVPRDGSRTRVQLAGEECRRIDESQPSRALRPDRPRGRGGRR